MTSATDSPHSERTAALAERAAALGRLAPSCRAIGFEKPGAGPGYWSDVVLLEEKGGLFFYAHARGMAFHYPKRGVQRPCIVPCVVFLDPRTCTAGYVMKKARVFDLVPEALTEEALRPFPLFEDYASLPVSLYVNVCEPGVFRYEADARRLMLRDMDLDLVKNVVAADVPMTPAEARVREALLAGGALLERRTRSLGPSAGAQGARTCEVEEFAPGVVDADELEAALAANEVSQEQAREARAIAADLLTRARERLFPFEEAEMNRLLARAFAAVER